MRFDVQSFRDLDLMLKIEHEGGNDGVEARALAESLGAENGTVIASRLNWMAQFGLLQFNKEHRLWTVSSSGARVVEAKLRGAASREIDAIPDEALIEVMAHVTSRFKHDDPVMGHMLRREFAYGTRPR
jgi:hypothetical protein